MNTTRNRPVATRATAIYLRCYPYDAAYLLDFWDVLARHALERGLGESTVFLDNGKRSGDPLPALHSLLRAAGQGLIRAVVVPGPFVFSLDDEVARATMRQLADLGCEVYELPNRLRDRR